jgi:hypothetical protein
MTHTSTKIYVDSTEIDGLTLIEEFITPIEEQNILHFRFEWKMARRNYSSQNPAIWVSI